MIHRCSYARWLHALIVAGGLLSATTPALAQRGSILGDVPAQVRPGARYLIYLHGRIVEEQGSRPTDERFGVYEYQQILDTLAASGAEVIAEQRPQGTDFRAFGGHVADQVRRLIAAGVPAERIAVVGFSKGGAIAMIASALLADPAEHRSGRGWPARPLRPGVDPGELRPDSWPKAPFTGVPGMR